MTGRFKKARGFVLSELLVVMGVMALAVAMMAFLVASQTAREQEQRANAAKEAARGMPAVSFSGASSAEPMSARSPNTGLSKQEALALEKARVEELDAARDKRELVEALAKSTREASELKAALAKEQAARAQAQSERSQAFADLAQSRAGLMAPEQAKLVDDQPRWLEMFGSAALELAVLGVAGLVGAACRRGRSASP